jgi:hypothetical protein
LCDRDAQQVIDAAENTAPPFGYPDVRAATAEIRRLVKPGGARKIR